MASLTAAAILLVSLALVWLISLLERNAGIVDIYWGFGFVLVAWACAYDRGFALEPLQWLLVAMVSVWGLRLTIYLGWRNLLVYSEEDPRYQSLRERIGPTFWWSSLFLIFWMQGALLYVVCLPVQGALLNDAGGGLDGLDVALTAVAGLTWLVGLGFETVGDLQLARFKADPDNAGKVMDRGLWRYTRHPNYFGDFCVWWAHFGVAVVLGAPWWTAIGPALMSFLLLRVSGVPLLERKLVKTRPGYEDYVRRTSAFFPRPPRD